MDVVLEKWKYENVKSVVFFLKKKKLIDLTNLDV